LFDFAAAVAQLVERQIVVLDAAGSKPASRPISPSLVVSPSVPQSALFEVAGTLRVG
jgi:hypothetical protein